MTRPVVGASVDLGATSVHLLVATVVDHRLEPLAEESAFLGLGGAIDAGERLGVEGRAVLAETMLRYAEIARRYGATEITFIGTEPIRRAADAALIVNEIMRVTGVGLHVLSHEEEALLTLIGVTEGRLLGHDVLVIDIGGGSSEFVVVGPSSRAAASGVQLGAARLTGRYATQDPPTIDDIESMRAAARAVIAGAPDARPDEIVIVGGTASNLCKVIPGARVDRVLTREKLAVALDVLLSEPAALAATRHGVKPIRARILPAGAVIVDAILERYSADAARVSGAGIREGAILVVAHAGIAWRDRLETLAHGWREWVPVDGLVPAR